MSTHLLELDRRTPVPLRDGFDYITDLRNWPEHWPGLVRVEHGPADRR